MYWFRADLSGRTTALTLGISRFSIDQKQFWLDIHKQFVYFFFMIHSFSDAETRRFYTTGQSRRYPPSIQTRAAMRLTQLDSITRLDDLRLPPSNRLERLKGNRIGQWSIRINNQWRVCFRFEQGDVFDVEIVDYH